MASRGDPATGADATATNSGSSSVQAVSLSPADAAVVHPETDGTTYVVGREAGTRLTWHVRVETKVRAHPGPAEHRPG